MWIKAEAERSIGVVLRIAWGVKDSIARPNGPLVARRPGDTNARSELFVAAVLNRRQLSSKGWVALPTKQNAPRVCATILGGIGNKWIVVAEQVVLHSPPGLHLPAQAQVQRQMRSDFEIIAPEQRSLPHISAGGVCFVDVPSINVTRQKIGVGNSGDAAIELEVTGVDVTPARIVLVKPVVLAADLNRVPAPNERQNVRDGVDSFAQRGVDVPVPAAGAQH